MEDCIFCKIIAGEIPSATVYEDNDYKAILDAFPANKGHVLVLTKKHAQNAFEVDEELAAGAFKLAVRIAKAMEGHAFAEGVNILQNNNLVAGQTVFHFHIHIIPRLSGDSVSVAWKTGAYADGEAAEYAKTILRKMN